MKYQEMLDFSRENNAYGSQFYIAEELECDLRDIQEIEYTPERFEELCSCVWDAYLKSENNNLFSICRAVAKLEAQHVNEGGKNPLEMSKWDILEEAAWCE